jgi:hypothetical protein
MIYETDTDKTLFWDGSAWANVNSVSPVFTGTPTAPTATAGTNTTQLATTAFVTTADNLKANLASPTLTGTPLAPNAAAGTNTTQIATTAWVLASIQMQGGIVSAGTSGTTVTFASGRFQNSPAVTLGPGYVTASGANPSGFAFIPYGGGPSTASVIIACTSGTIQVNWIAMARNF